ncbi:hypothetical protein SAMN05421505_12631 [Sinosporangium album]|uniref:Uncharacterized protein n=1 Tax=Sinosporangium album TaxID=504805 RepID=A0A1G8G9K2_9ACTN|nr:hypothetical protein [Sinosporangium album]SDH91064.1 hypothetical protein SAMN05421505_12631 [Sinosporangium album]
MRSTRRAAVAFLLAAAVSGFAAPAAMAAPSDPDPVSGLAGGLLGGAGGADPQSSVTGLIGGATGGVTGGVTGGGVPLPPLRRLVIGVTDGSDWISRVAYAVASDFELRPVSWGSTTSK